MPIVVNSNASATQAINLSHSTMLWRQSLASSVSGSIPLRMMQVVWPSLISSTQPLTVVRGHSKCTKFTIIPSSARFALGVVGNILDRMAELRTMAQDITKNSGDIETTLRSLLNCRVNSAKFATRSLTASAYSRFNQQVQIQLMELPQVSYPWVQVPMWTNGNTINFISMPVN